MVEIKSVLVRNYNWKDVIKITADDCDANGDNGLEVLEKEAAELGFKNNAEYYLNLADISSNDVEKKINTFMELYTSTWNCCCDEHSFKIIKYDDLDLYEIIFIYIN